MHARAMDARLQRRVQRYGWDKAGKGILSWMIGPLIALMALTGSSRSQSLLEVSLTYLQRHGVPCKSVVKIDSTDTLDEVATCQDGSEWVLLWLENEIAFVRPGSHQLYRWRRDVYNLYPYLYSIEKGESGPPRKSEPGEQAFSQLRDIAGGSQPPSWQGPAEGYR